MLVGPMVARFGKAMISKPGGDKIGRRRLDTHFIGIQNLGADFVYNEERGIYEISAKQLHGSYMLLDEASVTGTANIVMAAVLAKGKTTIYNAACEPYVQQLCRMLNRMGAKIEGIASNLLTIEGVDELHGTEHTILPDMIEVGSFIGMAAMTRSELTIKNVSYENLGIIPRQFPSTRHQDGAVGRRHLRARTRDVPDRVLYRRLHHDHCRRTLARTDTRLAQCAAGGGCHPGKKAVYSFIRKCSKAVCSLWTS